MLASQLRAEHGVSAQAIVADLAVSIDLERVAASLIGDTNVTFLVNNAGTSTLAPVADTDPTALVRLTRAVLPGFMERNHGTIINIGSVLGLGTIPGSSAYSGTKGMWHILPGDCAMNWRERMSSFSW